MHLENAPASIVLKVEGRVTLVNGLSAKAPVPIAVTGLPPSVDGMVTAPETEALIIFAPPPETGS